MRRMLLVLAVVLMACASDETEPEALGLGSNDPSTTTTSSSTAASSTTTTTAPTTTIAEATTTTEAPTTTAPSTDNTSAADGGGCVTITDFTTQNEAWRAVNDGVMGGRSDGGPTFDADTMVFAGEINTNGGGFSSVRALLAPNALAGAGSIRVVGLPDDRSYRLILSDAAEGRDRRVSHQGDLVFSEPTAPSTPDGVATVALDSLETSVFGRLVFTEPFEPALAVEIGIQIADGIDGPFELTVDRIERCPA